jgi:hypothetical protein
MLRFIRAFFIALKMTLRGETPPPLPYQALRDWIEQGQELSQAAVATADESGLDAEQRKTITVIVDGREHSLETILQAVHYHLTTEYPYMLQHLTRHTVTAIYASNMNDQYAVDRVSNVPGLKDNPTGGAVNALRDHLNAIPQSNSLNLPDEMK